MKSQKKLKEQKEKELRKRRKEKSNSEKLFKYIDQEYKDIKSTFKENAFFILILLFIFLMVIFQFNYENKEHLGLNKLNEEQYYTVLGLEDGSSLEEVRAAYKQLVRAWHPDKHPNCKSCREKFNKITEAYEAIIKMFEEGNKKSIFRNSPTSLNINNYHRLVESSIDFWVIFVYNSKQISYFTNQIASVFNEVNGKLKNSIKFGTIDISREEQLLVYLPYKFPILPVIFTYDSKSGTNELFQGIDHINEINFYKFIQDTYSTKIELLDLSKIHKFIGKVNSEKIVKNDLNINKDLDLSLFVISPKNFIDLAAKDFQRRYENEIKIYQNTLGTYDDTIKAFEEKIKNKNNNYRVYVSYNNITKKEKNEIKLIKKLEPIAININYRDNVNTDFINIFEVSKKLTMPLINRRNFLPHCKSTIQNVKVLEGNIKTLKEKINVCVIEIVDDDLDKNVKIDENFQKNVDLNLYEIILDNFQKENDAYKSNNHNYININYAKASLKKNKKLNEFMKEYELKNSENKDNENTYYKKFLIMDINNHQFLLKKYKSNEVEKMKEFFERINNEETLEDISLGYEYFTDYIQLEETTHLFDEIRIFSFKNILWKSVYSQTKPRYLFIWIIVFFSFNLMFKDSSNTSLLKTGQMIILSIIAHFAVYGYNSYFGNI